MLVASAMPCANSMPGAAQEFRGERSFAYRQLTTVWLREVLIPAAQVLIDPGDELAMEERSNEVLDYAH